jgi:hypothetical protein
MGCDIHLYIEKKIDNRWVPAQGFFLIDKEDTIPNVPYPDRFGDRDYLLFGFLAGVRDSTNQHFEPRGFPKDASKEVRDQFVAWNGDAHTPSYLTLEELKAVDWDNELVTIDRLFRKDQLEAFNKSVSAGEPDYDLITTWCAWSSDKENWIHSTIEVPIKYQFQRFYHFMNKLQTYSWVSKPDEIRIVFWFDN